MKKNFFRIISLVSTIIILALMLFSCSGSAADQTYISDTAGELSDEAKTTLKTDSDDLFDNKGVRLMVYVVSNTGSETLKSYAERTYQSFDIEYGILILVSTEDANYYAVQNKATSDYLPDNDFSTIVKDNMEDKFAEGNYADALIATVKAFKSYFETNLKSSLSSGSGGIVILWIVIILALLLALGYCALLYMEKRKARMQRYHMQRRPNQNGNNSNRPRPEQPYRDPRYQNQRQRMPQNDPRRNSSQQPRQGNMQYPGGPVARQRVDDNMRSAATVTINTAALKKMRNSDSDNNQNNYR